MFLVWIVFAPLLVEHSIELAVARIVHAGPCLNLPPQPAPLLTPPSLGNTVLLVQPAVQDSTAFAIIKRPSVNVDIP